MRSREILTAADGHQLGAYVASPAGVPLGGLVVCQEVMGVNAHIRDVAERYARQGYLAIAPAFFDRKQRDVELGYTGDDVARGRDIRNSIPWNDVVLDVDAAAKYAGRAGRVTVVGYCWGGSIAWLAACRLPIAAAICFYGGQIHPHRRETPGCPTLLHFGETDRLVPMDHVEDIRKLHPDVESYVYPAGHGFDCDARSEFDSESSRLARKRTGEFLTAQFQKENR